MVSPAASARSLARVIQICESADDTDVFTLRRNVLDEIRRVVGFDWYVWLLTDPETSVGSTPLAEVPPQLLPKLPRLIRLKYLTAVNRWTTLSPSAASLSGATRWNLSQSLVWREMLASKGIVDMASMVFTDRFGCWDSLTCGAQARPRRSPAMTSGSWPRSDKR